MEESSEWIEFESRGKRYRAQFAETGLIIQALRYVCTKPHNMFDQPSKDDWQSSAPPQWDAVEFRGLGTSELLHAIEAKAGIRGRDQYARRRRYTRGNTKRCEAEAAAWLANQNALTVAQGRVLIDAAYQIVDAGAWLNYPYDTVERLYWHKRELAAWKDAEAVYAPWVDLKTWLIWALRLSRKADRWKTWRAAVAEVQSYAQPASIG